LLRRATQVSLRTLTRMEDFERIDDVGEWDRRVSRLPFLVLCGIDHDDVLVCGLRIRLINDFGDVLWHGESRVASESVDEYRVVGYVQKQITIRQGSSASYESSGRTTSMYDRWMVVAVKRINDDVRLFIHSTRNDVLPAQLSSAYYHTTTDLPRVMVKTSRLQSHRLNASSSLFERTPGYPIWCPFSLATVTGQRFFPIPTPFLHVRSWRLDVSKEQGMASHERTGKEKRSLIIASPTARIVRYSRNR